MKVLTRTFPKMKSKNSPPQPEDGLQATIDELKELNLGKIEDSRPIFVCALLSTVEDEQYFNTLNTSDCVGFNVITIDTDYEADWRKPLMEYLKHDKLPNDTHHKTEVQRRLKQFHSKVKRETVVDFIRVNVIFRYGVPRYIITGNGKPFYNKSMDKRDWHEKIGEALWAYQTTHRTATQTTPYSLVYKVEVVLPSESQIPSLRIVIQEGLTLEDNARLR
ncbi:UNVERIFIED_CONTAM: hypothetical protein Scaly_2049500 [Sesamum calycinum]|uniref:Uncharacterized protein n=1 Tax=Sesamum calycinum TaxID=2727403 RepID=A0AAW2N233_9LAMI